MTMNIEKRPRRTYTDEFKNQVVQLYKNGKRKCDIIREYDIASSLLDKWIRQADNMPSKWQMLIVIGQHTILSMLQA
jgi:transposase